MIRSLTFRSRAIIVVGLMVTLSGCGMSTKGKEGLLYFAYKTDSECFWGCEVDRPLLQGSSVEVAIRGESLQGTETATFANSAVGVIRSSSSTCECIRTDGREPLTRAIGASKTCGDSERKSCEMALQVSTVGTGTSRLSIRRRGELVDAIDLTAAPVSRVQIDVTVDGVPLTERQGVYVVKRGASLLLSVSAFFEDGSEPVLYGSGSIEVFGDLGLQFSATGGGRTQYATPRELGESNVAIRVGDKESTIRVRVE